MTLEPKFKLLTSLAIIAILALLYIQVTSLYTSPVHKLIKKDESWIYIPTQQTVTRVLTTTVTHEVFKTILSNRIPNPTLAA